MGTIIGLTIFIIVSIAAISFIHHYNEMSFDPLGGETFHSPPKNEIPDSLDLEMIEERFGSIERKPFSITGKALFAALSSIEVVNVIDNKLIKPYPTYPTETMLLFENRVFLVKNGIVTDELGKHDIDTLSLK